MKTYSRVLLASVIAFVSSFATDLAQGVLFTSYLAYATGSRPEAVAVGDLNGDGRKDVVMTTSFSSNTNDNSILIFYQNSFGLLDSPVRYGAGAGAYSVAVADFDGDGRNDIAVGKKSSGVRVFTQRMAGGFTNYSDLATAYANWICHGDFNHDGRADLAGIGFSGSKVALFLQNSNGALVFATNYDAAYSGYNDVEAGDVNGDGLTDIVVMNGQTYAVPNVSILLQTNGGFAPAITCDLGGNELTSGVGVGDVTGDGLNNIVVSYGGNQPDARLAVFSQTSGGIFTLHNTYEAYHIPEPVVVADLDLDGRADVVTLHGGWQALGVLMQNAEGTLDEELLFSPLPYASSYNPHGLTVGDINSDGMPDVAIADYNHGLVVLTNALSPPPLLISRLKLKADGSVALTVPYLGPNNSCAIEACETLTNWVTIGVATESTWTDHAAATRPSRFYRAKMQ